MDKKIEVDKEVIDKAEQCNRTKACLSDPDSICPIKSPASNNLVFIQKDMDKMCNYYVYFGYGGFCNCPVRKEIYRKYGK